MSVREESFPVDGPLAVDVRNPAGSVALTAREGGGRVEVRVEALDPAAAQLLEAVDIATSSSDGERPQRVRVTVPERWLFRTPRFAVTVRGPAATDARLAVASADVDVRGPVGALTVTAASGDVAVESARELNLRSASGDVRVGSVADRATVGTASGDLRVDTAGDRLEVRTASGNVAVGRAGAEVSVGTASGDVRIDAVEQGRVRLTTVSGDTTVGVAPGQRVWLELSSASGRMHSELTAEEGAAAADDRAGPATVSITARTVSGDVRIVRAAHAPA
ncbi:DUF4097 domain-containing protein [Geodermatophilus sp. YIM 151500]|uniref:DUF4097 family beta strand repeat-containing protein n=1 Tax=Geodermatophilus sp. YIM 151500 TaxID=2984531 RepID=UPI0021E411A7|nr:DUF4097 domain-containing protein [Geodermatophilus sp. YIM 151500]MCV2488439.1 DUF4097 domain-containing protein [Geodermatophilus sp. YIM 151500]